jgi:hypothetical protein
MQQIFHIAKSLYISIVMGLYYVHYSMPVKKPTRSTTSAAPAKKVAKKTPAKKTPAKKTEPKKVAAKKSPAKKVAPKKNEPYVPSRLASAYSTDISKGKHLVIVESPAKARTIS